MKFLKLFLFLFCSHYLFSQQNDLVSKFTSEKYYQNPSLYLSKLDTTKIGSDLLIDRAHHFPSIYQSNGKDKVLDFTYSDFFNTYSSIKAAYQEKTQLISFDTLLTISRQFYDSRKVNFMVGLDFSFKSIDSLALQNREFTEGVDFLSDENASDLSYLNNRVVTFTCFKENFYGNEVKFFFDKDLIIRNNSDDFDLLKMEVDFDNGQGFIELETGKEISVNYSGPSSYLVLRLKLTYEDKSSLETHSVYAHSKVFRKSTGGIPTLQKIEDYSSITDIQENSSGGRTSKVQTVDQNASVRFNFPKERITQVISSECTTIGILKCFPIPTYYWETVYSPYTLDVAILFNPRNDKLKLRRPLIMVDGFDPGNKRDYYSTLKDQPLDSYLPKERDVRGLYELLDGQRSPWDKFDDNDLEINDQEQDAGMVKALQEQGFDIVFVNFRNGAGNINENANRIRSFLNQVINDTLYRDNKTEEAVLVGPSMGGIITRIALTEMEKAGEEHFVKTWISFDSPHMGANIPVGLQFAMKKLSKSIIPAISAKAKEAIGVMNTEAAKQLFHQHYASMIEPGILAPDDSHVELLKKLKRLQFPKLSHNLAITNGSRELLYPNTVSQIGKLTVNKSIDVVTSEINTQVSGVVSNTDVLKLGNEIVYIYPKNVLQISNSPGGWHGALYSFNKVKDNKHFSNLSGEQYDKATFIPTVSAFGRHFHEFNIQLDWKKFAPVGTEVLANRIITPFDDLLGMEGENQEHVKISSSTKDHVINKWLKPELESTVRPFYRHDKTNSYSFANDTIHQTISKPCAYVLQDSILFASKANTFTLKNGADVNVVAGKRIVFDKGFSTEQGVKMFARIEVILDKSTLRTINKPLVLGVSSSQDFTDSPTQQLHDYTKNSNVPNTKVNINTIEIYPNPVENQLNFSVLNSFSRIDIIDAQGRIVKSEKGGLPGKHQLNVQQLTPGIYLMNCYFDGEKVVQKIIKR